jgi:hypothetical protein
VAYLGLAVAGFEPVHRPGAGQPSAATNFVAAMEQHGGVIGDCITYLRDGGYRTIEALPDAAGVDRAHDVARGTDGSGSPDLQLLVQRRQRSGKKRMHMGYTAGIPEYRRRCDEVAADGYAGFVLG